MSEIPTEPVDGFTVFWWSLRSGKPTKHEAVYRSGASDVWVLTEGGERSGQIPRWANIHAVAPTDAPTAPSQRPTYRTELEAWRARLEVLASARDEMRTALQKNGQDAREAEARVYELLEFGRQDCGKPVTQLRCAREQGHKGECATWEGSDK